MTSSVTCMSWPKDKSNDLVIGLAEGKVYLNQKFTFKSQILRHFFYWT